MRRPAVVLLLAAAIAHPQVAEKANSHYQTREGRGNVARWLSAADRDKRQRPHELVAAMAVKPGMTVADLGTGIGYMLPFLSRAVGPSGHVIAQDIFPDFLEQAKRKAEGEKLGNVSFVQGTDRDPKLPERSADVVLALDAYHHFDYPAEMLAGIARSLRDGGRFVVVDFYKSKFDNPEHIRLEEPDVIKEIEANGFRLAERRTHADQQYVLVFKAE